MNSTPIVPARFEGMDSGAPWSPEYADRYHPQAGAVAQARHVFLGGNGLPSRWQRRELFVVLETGFGLGNNFLATWDAWRNDAQRCETLHFISIEKHPLTRADLACAARDPALQPLANELLSAWPPLTHNLHRLSFESGHMQLLLAFGDVQAWLPELLASVDAFYLDGFAPARNPAMWDERVCKALGRLAAPEATLATWTAAQALRSGLTTAGFEVRLAAGAGGKRDITLARFAPAFQPRRAPARSVAAAAADHSALIIGAGLAGCAAALGLAERGWRSRVLERRSEPAAEGSGNPAGLFHGIVNAHDGVHARFNRAAALVARTAVAQALSQRRVRGSVAGLLRLETVLSIEQMRQVLSNLGSPEVYVRALGAAQASSACGLALPCAAWFYPGGGWVEPGALARAFLAQAAPLASVQTGVDVQSLRRFADRWQALDARGQVIGEAATLVLANAGDALRLLGSPGWPIEKQRGQVSFAEAAQLGSAPATRLPIAGAGYLLPELDGRVMFGATAQPGDDDPTVRDADHLANLAQLARLTGQPISLELARLGGRTAWRWSCRDRLPLIGAVPEAHGSAQRLDHARFVPRIPGLFVFTALGSRGITWSALGGQIVAALIAGTPVPVEASLLDAVDPARFAVRRARRALGR